MKKSIGWVETATGIRLPADYCGALGGGCHKEPDRFVVCDKGTPFERRVPMCKEHAARHEAGA